MENMFNFTETQLLQEWVCTDSYQELLVSLDVIAVGLEGLEILVQLKADYPHLQVGYIYHESLDELPVANGRYIRENFTFISLNVSIKYLKGDWYVIQSLNKNFAHATLNLLSKKVLIIGAMTDPILLRLLEFYEFTQRKLLLRRPMFYETSSLRGSIHKFLLFSELPRHIQVIDTVKIYRCIKKLGLASNMVDIHQEVYAHWCANMARLLKLTVNEE